MVSLWGSKDNGEEHEEGDESPPDGEESRRQPQRHSRGQDPDERSRLLPPRNDGFLDPDDPAVGVLGFHTLHERLMLHRCLRIIYGASGLYATYAFSS